MSFIFPSASAATRDALRQSLKTRSERFRDWLESGQIRQVVSAVDADPEALADLIPLVADAAAPMNVRIGTSAVLERYAGTPRLAALTGSIARLTTHADARVRADACYFLGLGLSPESVPYLEACRNDPDADVREIATEGLAAINSPQ
jgi:hypothetical protein